jgi:hypothetical protein
MVAVAGLAVAAGECSLALLQLEVDRNARANDRVGR